MPLWPLAATLAVQTLATIALYSVPAIAPEVAQDLNVSGAIRQQLRCHSVWRRHRVGVCSGTDSVRRQGVCARHRAVLLAAAGRLVAGGAGDMASLGLALAAVVLGLGYARRRRLSTRLLVPQNPAPGLQPCHVAAPDGVRWAACGGL